MYTLELHKTTRSDALRKNKGPVRERQRETKRDIERGKNKNKLKDKIKKEIKKGSLQDIMKEDTSRDIPES